jgi:hypothetical protein
LQGIVAGDVARQGGQEDAAPDRIGQIARAIVIDRDDGRQGDAGLALEEVGVLLDRRGENLLDHGEIGGAAVNLHGIFLNFNEALNNELLDELGIVGAFGNGDALLRGFLEQLLQERITQFHLFDAAFADLIGTGDAILYFAVFFLFEKLFLHGQFGFVHERLLLQIEVVFRLRFWREGVFELVGPFVQ